MPGADLVICARRGFPSMKHIERFSSGLEPWRTTVIDTAVRGEYRPGVRGPLALFSNDAGQSEVCLSGRTLPLAAQNFALSPAGEKFTLTYPEHASTHALNVYFSEELVRETRGAVLDTPALRPIDATLRRALDRVRRSLDQPLACEEAIVELLGLVLAAKGPGVEANDRALARRISRTIDYLVAFSDREVTLEHLAQVCGFSKFHFLRLFRSATGRTPSRFLAEVRVQRAKALLAASERPIGEIALDVGFSEQSALSRAFRRVAGVSPQAYRAHAH